MQEPDTPEAIVAAWETDLPPLDLGILADNTVSAEQKIERLRQSTFDYGKSLVAQAEKSAPQLENLVERGNDALPALRKALRSPSVFVRTNACFVLSEIHTSESTQLLIEAYRTEQHSMVRAPIIHALSERDDPALPPLFLATLQKAAGTSDDSNERFQQNLRDGLRGKIDLMKQVLSGSFPLTAPPTSEIKALARWKVREAVPFIVQLLPTQTVPILQRELIAALGLLGDQAALPALRALLAQAPPVSNAEPGVERDLRAFQWHQAELTDALEQAIQKLEQSDG